MSLITQTKLAAHLVKQMTNLSGGGWDSATHHSFMFLNDLAANSEISKNSLDEYSSDYIERVEAVQWINKDSEREALVFAEKLTEYKNNPTEDNAQNILH
ncbi:MAG: hypothetical protein H9W81_13735 [Enterococcus sp.]|nr:hypothetical protein [Enterococcus sp.]